MRTRPKPSIKEPWYYSEPPREGDMPLLVLAVFALALVALVGWRLVVGG